MHLSISSSIAVAVVTAVIAVGCVVTDNSVDLNIISRLAWGAKPALKQMNAHNPVRITLHHTATGQKPHRSLTAKLKALQDYSQSRAKLASGKRKKAWSDIPYHFYISESGEIAEGLPLHFSGDTNTNYNPKGHISIVLEGNFNKEEPGSKQLSGLVGLMTLLVNRYEISVEAIGGHKQYAATACPGHNLQALLGQVRSEVARAR